MRKRADFLKFIAAPIASGVVAKAAETPAFAKDRDVIGSTRIITVHDCILSANKFNPITQLSNQCAEYGTCMARHGQRYG